MCVCVIVNGTNGAKWRCRRIDLSSVSPDGAVQLVHEADIVDVRGHVDRLYEDYFPSVTIDGSFLLRNNIVVLK